MCWSAASPVTAQTALTLYNQQFAVVRETLPLALERGENRVRFNQVTAYLEPETVIVRDPSGKVALRVLEQNYLADPLSIDSMLSRHEGRTIQFLTREGEETRIVEGRIIRAGPANPPVASHSARFAGPYGVQYGQAPRGPAQTIVEVDGRTRFQLPGIPLFPPLEADALLKPAIEWVIESPAAAQLDAEVAYISGGLNWTADYNVVSPADGDALELIGWVTMRNDSGKSFEGAQVKLMAGDVSKLDPRRVQVAAVGGVVGGVAGGVPGPPQVTERTFDEYHLYSLERVMNLRDGETKQVEFLRASGIKAKLI